MSPEAFTVFVVDDDLSHRRALARLLRSEGYEVATFDSAQAFLDSTARLQPHACLVLDMQMPHMDGFALQERLQAEHCKIPIVFITAFESELNRASAMSEGAIAFIYKGNHSRQLLRAVKTARERTAGVSTDPE